MSSVSLEQWNNVRVLELDEIENAHRQVGGGGRGRRYATQQINHAYAVLLSSQFQGFCRDLHSECIYHIVRGTQQTELQRILRSELSANRKLDRGNPNPGNIGSDFNRLGVTFWPNVKSLDARNEQRMRLLEELNEWRNAIAHQDFDPVRLGSNPVLNLAKVQSWRRACASLAISFDKVMSDHLESLFGTHPW